MQCVAPGHQSPADSRHFWHSSVSCFHCATGEPPFIQPRKGEGKETGGKYTSGGREKGERLSGRSDSLYEMQMLGN